jgi:hypothetical protein
MGFASEEMPAPDYIRDLLLARIEREPQLVEQAIAQHPEKKTDVLQGKTVLSPSASSVLSQPKQERLHILPWLLAAALVALAIASFFLWKTLQDKNNQLQANLSAAWMNEEDLQKQIDSHKGKSRELEQILAIVHKPGTRIARLIGQALTPDYAGAIFWDLKKGECLAVASFLPAPQGKVYQLWFFSATTKVPVGLIRTNSKGRVFMMLAVPKAAEGATAAVVTLESDKGSQIPTAPYCAAGRID